MSSLFDAAGKALATAARLTETQARGTVRLVLRELGKGIDASRADYVKMAGEPLRAALEKRHVAGGERLSRAVLDAIIAAPDDDEDALGFFRDID